jgi:hypothetical protein
MPASIIVPAFNRSERVIGTAAFVAAGLTLKSTNRRKNPIDGESRVYVYVGTQAAVLNAYATINETDYLEVEVDETSAPEYRLIVNAPDDSVVNSVTNYEVLGNEITKSIYEADRTIALGNQTLRDIRDRINRDESGDGLSNDAKILYNLAKAGVTGWEVSQFVYRVTKVVSRKYTQKVAYNNIGRIYKTTQVIAETQPPPGLVFSLSDIKGDSSASGPNDIAETPGVSAETGWIYGWKKGTPTTQRVAGFRIAISTEFKLGIWSTYLYKAAV